MEFYDLGKHCSDEMCKQKDFLPINCDKCQKSFCHQHYGYDHHKCIHVDDVDDVHEYTSISEGANVESETILKKTVKKRKCKSKKCGERNFLLECKFCQMRFCLSHRHPEDHLCVKYQNSSKKMKNVIQNQWKEKLNKKSSIFLQDEYTNEFQYRKFLISVKQVYNDDREKFQFTNTHSSAICPQYITQLNSSNSVVLKLVFPLDTNFRPVYLRCMNEWTIGKVTDLVCSAFDITKANHHKTLNSNSKLSLYSLKSMRLIGANRRVVDIVKNEEIDTVILERGSSENEQLLREETMYEILFASNLPQSLETCRQSIRKMQEQMMSNYNKNNNTILSVNS